jgi:hypothetical protein
MTKEVIVWGGQSISSYIYASKETTRPAVCSFFFVEINCLRPPSSSLSISIADNVNRALYHTMNEQAAAAII